MSCLRMSEDTVNESITVDYLLEWIKMAKSVGLITGSSKVVQSQMMGRKTFPVRTLIAPGADDQFVLALSCESEEELISSGMFQKS